MISSLLIVPLQHYQQKSSPPLLSSLSMIKIITILFVTLSYYCPLVSCLVHTPRHYCSQNVQQHSVSNNNAFGIIDDVGTGGIITQKKNAGHYEMKRRNKSGIIISSSSSSRGNDSSTFFQLFSSSNDNNNDPPTIPKKRPKIKGVYARPSAAIEQGSGFFIPGLEGYRVRILFGLLVLVLDGINGGLGTFGGIGGIGTKMADLSLPLSELPLSLTLSGFVAAFYGGLLILQGFVELSVEIGLSSSSKSSSSSSSSSNNSDKEMVNETDNSITTEDSSISSSSSNNDSMMDQIVSTTLRQNDDEHGTYEEEVTWVSASLISLTPATHVFILRAPHSSSSSLSSSSSSSNVNAVPEIIYGLGTGATTAMEEFDDNDIDAKSAIISAVSIAHESKGGRVSLPTTHPASMLLPGDDRRCVILQRIGSESDDDDDDNGTRSCLIVGSNQLLAAFTKNDLRWIGQLAEYLKE